MPQITDQVEHDDVIVDPQDAADAAAAIEAFNKSFDATLVNTAGGSTASEEDAIDLTGAAADPAAAPAAAPAARAPRQPKAKKGEGASAPADGETGDGKVKDPFADADPHVKQILKDQLADRHRLRTLEGRYSKLESEHARLLRQQSGSAPVAAPAVGNGNVTTPPAAPAPNSKRRETLERLRGELPEVAELFDGVLTDIDNRAPAPKPAADGDGTGGEAAAKAAKAAAAEAAMASLDPAWRDKVNSEAWDLWLVTQPDAFQHQMMSTEDPLELAIGLRKFEAYRASFEEPRPSPTSAPARGSTPAPPPRNDVAARREARAAAAAAPPVSGARAAAKTEMTPEEAFEAGFSKVRSGTR